MRFEGLTRTLNNLHFSNGGSVDKRIEQVLEEKPSQPKKPELLALSPVIRPSDGAAALLYDYAFDPIKSDHPQHDIAEKLFNNGGILPPQEADATPDIQQMYKTKEDGTLTSPVIIDVFTWEKAVDEVSRRTPPNPGEGFAGRALKVKRIEE